MASLSDVSTPHRVGDRYQLEVSPGWRQGRGAFGGLVVGALVRAIEHHTADPARKVRSVTAELPGPVEPGTVDIAVETLRRGNNVSTVRAVLTQGSQGDQGQEIRSHAVAVVAANAPRQRPPAPGPGTTWCGPRRRPGPRSPRSPWTVARDRGPSSRITSSSG